LVVLWRLDPAFGTLAFALVLARFLQGQLDLFWIAVQVPLPFLVAGICLALQNQAAGPAGDAEQARFRSHGRAAVSEGVAG
jgi:hypothetical protein